MFDHVGVVFSDLEAGGKLGARNNGDPRVRRGRYYCAFLIDFDGNNIEAGVYA